MRTRRDRKGTRGFTLLEILVALGILALVLGLSISYLMDVREKTRRNRERAVAREMARQAVNMILTDISQTGYGVDDTNSVAGFRQPKILLAEPWQFIFNADLDTDLSSTDPTKMGAISFSNLGGGGGGAPFNLLYTQIGVTSPPADYGNGNDGAETIRYSLDIAGLGDISTTDTAESNYEDNAFSLAGLDAENRTPNPYDFFLVKEVWGFTSGITGNPLTYRGPEIVSTNIRGWTQRQTLPAPLNNDDYPGEIAGEPIRPQPMFLYYGHFENDPSANGLPDNPDDPAWPGEEMDLWGDWQGNDNGILEPIELPELLRVDGQYHRIKTSDILELSDSYSDDRNGNGVRDRTLDDVIRRVGVVVTAETSQPDPKLPFLPRSRDGNQNGSIEPSAGDVGYFYWVAESTAETTLRNVITESAASRGGLPTPLPSFTPTMTPSPTPSPTPTESPTLTPTEAPTATFTITPTASPSPTVTIIPILAEIVIGTENTTGNNMFFWRMDPDGNFIPSEHMDVHVDGAVEQIRTGNFMWDDSTYGDGNSTPGSNPSGWWDAMVMTNGKDEDGNPVPGFSLWRNNSTDDALAPASDMYEQVMPDTTVYPPLPYWIDPAVDPFIDFDVADLDGDGDLEMVAAAGNTIMLYDLVWNSVLGQMEIVELSCPNWAFEYDPDPAAADIIKVGFVQADGDGHLDLVVCTLAPFTGGEKVHVYTNNGGNGCYHVAQIYWEDFTEMRKQVNYILGGQIYLEPGYVQQDLVMGDAAGTLVLAENTLGTYNAHNFNTPPNITALEFFDLYGTPHEELIVLTGSENFRNLYFFRNDPINLPSTEPVQSQSGENFLYPSPGVSLSAVAAGYLNYDETGPMPNGWPDLLLGARNGYVYVELNEGAGIPPFSPPYEYRQNVGAPVTVLDISHGVSGSFVPFDGAGDRPESFRFNEKLEQQKGAYQPVHNSKPPAHQAQPPVHGTTKGLSGS